MARGKTRKILYICDRKRCPNCNSECHLTSDIWHAKNFKKSNYIAADGGESPWIETEGAESVED